MTTETDTPISPLVAELLSASLSITHDTTNRLIDSLTTQLADAHAELGTIRHDVTRLADGNYMPTPAAIGRALWPAARRIQMFREAGAR